MLNDLLDVLLHLWVHPNPKQHKQTSIFMNYIYTIRDKE